MTRLTAAMTTVPARARVFAVFGPPPNHKAATKATAMTFVTAAMVRTVHRVIDTSQDGSASNLPLWCYFRNGLFARVRRTLLAFALLEVIAPSPRGREIQN
jgi:hypothetical protein